MQIKKKDNSKLPSNKFQTEVTFDLSQLKITSDPEHCLELNE